MDDDRDARSRPDPAEIYGPAHGTPPPSAVPSPVSVQDPRARALLASLASQVAALEKAQRQLHEEIRRLSERLRRLERARGT